jgi:UDP-N-acetylmuramoyl-L-alanyl-D-glutamate--2,6-diaminopimelate ligase
MRLAELLTLLSGAELRGSGDVRVTGITLDSRQVQPGAIFAALPGEQHHGLEYLDEAIAAGAAAILTDRPPPSEIDLPWIISCEPRRLTALAAWALAGDPQRRLRLVGITGTNGKSTVADLVVSIFNAAGFRCGLLGTLGYRISDRVFPAERTTPEATDMAPLLRRMANSGCTAAVMEVSSHSIDQDRVAGLSFDVAVWTNLSREHLDYHQTMESYFETKKRLFTKEFLRYGRRVLPVDDIWVRELLRQPQPGDVSWGIDDGLVHTSQVRSSIDGSLFLLHMPSIELMVHLKLIGRHNLENAVAAAAAAYAAGVPNEAIRTGLEQAQPISGRMERVEVDLPFPVFIDYAHTPDGLRAVLTALTGLSDRRLIVVFGAGGDRDQGKRFPMGKTVGELAHEVIIASDNPRSEDPVAIAEAVGAGVRAAGCEPTVVLDRRQAIAHALQVADESSLVLLLGKGHERCQIIGDERFYFCESEIVSELAAERSCG